MKRLLVICMLFLVGCGWSAEEKTAVQKMNIERPGLSLRYPSEAEKEEFQIGRIQWRGEVAIVHVRRELKCVTPEDPLCKGLRELPGAIGIHQVNRYTLFVCKAELYTWDEIADEVAKLLAETEKK